MPPDDMANVLSTVYLLCKYVGCSMQLYAGWVGWVSLTQRTQHIAACCVSSVTPAEKNRSRCLTRLIELIDRRIIDTDKNLRG